MARFWVEKNKGIGNLLLQMVEDACKTCHGVSCCLFEGVGCRERIRDQGFFLVSLYLQ
jgi:hypothetical protein